ncbi:TlpA family protein disulfide reductase [Fuerstiella marisgermanici]|uniref:Thiol-disulfide oxidoreductase n=1 Tax=Fuerstiella marisgermanici TaxID=1891926 RepID=A0A1P8WHY1_9PLAN|nr:TlpA disulfide reductase family protein [Fuerstiella marisgermanici]APZ93662.1 thiol-disulfide oxidoreductase [Fuerstiella marisgermanici]
MGKFLHTSMVLTASFAWVGIAGCSNETAESTTPASEVAADSNLEKPQATEPAATEPAADQPSSTIELTEGEWSDVEEYVAAQKGKVVVVDLWSTSCLPCMTEFPHLVELHEKYGDDIVCMSFNLDYAGIKSKPPSYYRPRVEEFLQSRKAEFRNIMSTVDAIEVFDQLKMNSIPAVLVYGKDGKLAKRFDDTLLQDGEEEAFTYKDDINPFVQSLME